MPSLADYFDKNRPKPKFFIGDRVYGRLDGVLFIGTVANDSLKYEDRGPEVQVFTDLPFKLGDTYTSVITVPQSSLTLCKKYV